MKRLVAAISLALATLIGCSKGLAQPDSSSIRGTKLVEEAAEKIQGHAYYGGRVDWPSTIGKAKGRVTKGESLEDAHQAIDWMLRQLHDHHSFLLRSGRLKALSENKGSVDIEFTTRDFGDAVLVTVPTFVAMQAERERVFVENLHSNLSRHKPRCGWIVDLRSNEGGNMFAMLAGLAPLLGTEKLGSFVYRSKQTDWATREIFQRTGLQRETVEVPDLREAPVAVLTSRRTMSAGEAVAIAFRGRLRTRSFGDPTAGKTSGNEGVKLSDGSMLLLASALMADRTGTLYEGAIEPDQAIGSSDEAVMRPALAWLRSNCVARTP